MKIWTFAELKEKIEDDLDLHDEDFIAPNEMIGYTNEGILDSESEIFGTYKDYFITKYFVPTVVGQTRYVLPPNIFAQKIRNIGFANGSENYAVKRFRTLSEFQDIADIQQFSSNDYYQYTLRNDIPGQNILEIWPPSRETAILPPQSGPFTPMTLFYWRSANKIPLLGEYCNPEVVAPSQVNIGTDTITVNSGTETYGILQQGIVGCYPGSIAYKTGDKIKVRPGPGGTLPAPLAINTVYYAIAGAGTLKLATTKQDALSNIAIDLTTQGSVFFTIMVCATESIVDATLIDIPEFYTYIVDWVKFRCLFKEGDPRIEDEKEVLIAQRKQMVDTLTVREPTNDDEIQPDFSFYNDFS